MSLTKRARVADRSLAHFRNKAGDVVYVEITDEQYAAFGLPDAPPVELFTDKSVPPGYVCFMASGGTVTFDTPDGFLKPGDCYVGDPVLEAIAVKDDGTILVADAATAEIAK